MEFSEILKNLKDGALVGRESWKGIKYIQLKDNNLLEFVMQDDKSFKENHWNNTDEDILSATDWKVIEPDDVTYITLSISDLKKYVNSDEDINMMRVRYGKAIQSCILKDLNMNPNILLKNFNVNDIMNVNMPNMINIQPKKFNK